jgi:hypothetical protein
MWQWPCQSRTVISETPNLCVFGADWDRARTKAVLWGDSHAQHYAPLIEPVAQAASAAVALYYSCAPVVGANGTKYRGYHAAVNAQCASEREKIITALHAHPEIDLVVLAASWFYLGDTLYRGDVDTGQPNPELFEQAIETTIRDIARPGRRIVLLGTSPLYNQSVVPCNLANASLMRRHCSPPALTREASLIQKPTEDSILRAAAHFADVTVILTRPPMCESGICLTHVNGEVIYRDTSHFRRNLGEETKRELGKILGLDRIFSSPD